jgi:hypothetical protein
MLPAGIVEKADKRYNRVITEIILNRTPTGIKKTVLEAFLAIFLPILITTLLSFKFTLLNIIMNNCSLNFD